MLQGLFITIGCIEVGYYFMKEGCSEVIVRTSVFITLMISNVFLTLINRSSTYTILKSIHSKNNLLVLIVLITLALTVLFILIPDLRVLFQLSPLSLFQLSNCLFAAFFSTFWIEPFKLIKRKS